MSETKKFTSEEANVRHCPSKKPGRRERKLIFRKLPEKPEELERVIMFSFHGSVGLLKSNGV